jgi:hypothetical protein
MRWRAAITFPCWAEKTLLETERVRTEAFDPSFCALGSQTQHDYVRNVRLQRELTLRVLDRIDSKVLKVGLSGCDIREMNDRQLSGTTVVAPYDRDWGA